MNAVIKKYDDDDISSQFYFEACAPIVTETD